MRIDADGPSSSNGRWLRVAGAVVLLATVVAQALQIGTSWWNDPCGQLTAAERVACLGGGPPLYLKMAVLALGGWSLAGIALLLGRYLTPYISAVLPGGVVVVSIWLTVRYVREGVAFLAMSAMTRQGMILLAGMLGFLAMFYLGPVVGAWLAAFGARRRHRLRLERKSAELFD
jgi:hypothetical protein